MAGLTLREYQRESLRKIGGFCDSVRNALMARAVRPVHDAYRAETGQEINGVPQFPGIPYVCLRVPTGGGKTLIAAHAVGTIAKRLGHQDRPLCLWVSPSTTIRDQTLNGLRDPEHPYHAALRDSLGVPVEVMTIEDALGQATPVMLSSKAVIVVTTIQSYRIDDEANRRIYQDNGYLMDNFSDLPSWLQEQLREVDGNKLDLSLANVMKMRGPVVIMDEAHNARTRISFDSLARFGPLAVLELTATPQQEHDPAHEQYASNVLYAVSALQLKNEGMIKLPVELESRDTWLDVLATVKERRDALERRAAEWGRQSGRFIRPIALIQAQPHFQDHETHTVEKIKAALTGPPFNVPAERIRIVTGPVDDLGDEDLHGRECKVEYVLTVEKLRQGWDCPFAYVLGSVGNVATETAVEQLLGRVLRMPGATPTGVPELDRAYAIVQSQDVIEVATKLCGNLVKRCGFDPDSVKDAFRVHRPIEMGGLLPVAGISVSAPPNPGQLPPEVQAKVEYDAGSGTLQVRQPLTRKETVALRDSLGTPADRAAVEEYWQGTRAVGTAAKSLDGYAPPVRVPQLVVRDGERSYLFEPEELDEFEWNLDRCNPKISEADFSVELNVGERTALDLTNRGGVTVGGVEEVLVRQLSFLAEGDDWSKKELASWLDGELHRDEAFQGLKIDDSQAWMLRVVDYLLAERHADLRILVRKRHEIEAVVRRRIAEHGRGQVRVAANMLITGQSPRRLETSEELAAVLEEPDYCPYSEYHGLLTLPKHALDKIGAFDNEEESQCAKRIAEHPCVKRWLRNLSYESAGGFSLPLSPKRFYPDFIVEFGDGRLGIVEYKGKHRAPLSEEQHKKEVGELWAERSGGKCVFVWVVDRDWDTLEAGLRAIRT